MALSRTGEVLELRAYQLHEFGRTGEVPVRVAYLRVAGIRAQPEHAVFDRCACLVPSLNTRHRKGVAHVVDAWVRMVASGLPLQTGPHPLEYVLDRALGEDAAVAGYEERRGRARIGVSVSAIPILGQRLDHAGSDGQAARLVELRLPHGDGRFVKIDVTYLQLQGFGESEARSNDQAEERAVHEGAQDVHTRMGQASAQIGSSHSVAHHIGADRVVHRCDVPSEDPSIGPRGPLGMKILGIGTAGRLRQGQHICTTRLAVGDAQRAGGPVDVVQVEVDDFAAAKSQIDEAADDGDAAHA